jgi:GDPmannose 4,6-dehydratase|tara:strand:+ start:13645 stop:14697 length:1053 start_codon:yes stop_codon:yes gene_type:complete
MKKKTLVTGITGQDGPNMVDYLLTETDHLVFGMSRRSSNINLSNCESFLNNERFQLVYGDLTDGGSLDRIVQEIQPDYFVNFAANSFVGCSWDMPEHVMDTNALGTLRCLESIRRFQPKCRFYSAGSSEEMGDVDYSPQDKVHPPKPRSPYGVSKVAARFLTKVYRESYDIFAVHGILFNHEGVRRGEEFVTRKITKSVANIKLTIDKGEKFEPLQLGNVEAKRDWSDSEDFMDGIWKMLIQSTPKEYILSSNETHTVKEFVSLAFQEVGIPGLWSGEGLDEKFRTHEENKILAEINEEFYRPAEVAILHGDSTPIREELGWKPQFSFQDLVKRMVNNDLEIAKKRTFSP